MTTRNQTNRTAKYFSYVGSYDGFVKLIKNWVPVRELNRIDKSDWQRWSGPPSTAMKNSHKKYKTMDAAWMYPERVIHPKP